MTTPKVAAYMDSIRHLPYDQRTPEQIAKHIGNTPELLREVLNDSKNCRIAEVRAEFRKAKFDFANKCLISDNGIYRLQWRLRPRPDQPEGYGNQQSNLGICVLEVDWDILFPDKEEEV